MRFMVLFAQICTSFAPQKNVILFFYLSIPIFVVPTLIRVGVNSNSTCSSLKSMEENRNLNFSVLLELSGIDPNTDSLKILKLGGISEIYINRHE